MSLLDQYNQIDDGLDDDNNDNDAIFEDEKTSNKISQKERLSLNYLSQENKISEVVLNRDSEQIQTNNKINFVDSNVSNTKPSEMKVDNTIDNVKSKAMSDYSKERSNKTIIIEIIAIMIPTALNFFSIFLQQLLNTIFISKKYPKNPDPINGIGISSMYCNCTLVTIVMGLLNGFNVLGANAYGKKKLYLFGLYYQRCILITYTFAIVILLIHIFTFKRGLAFLGLTGDALDYGGSYMRISMFFVLFEILFNSSFRYLNIAKKGYITVIVLLVTTALHPLWCWLFIFKLDLGTEGAAISLVLSQFLTGTSLFLYINFTSPIPNTIFCINKDTFKGWMSYLTIAIPATLMLCFELWSYEIQQVIIANSGKDSAENAADLNTQVIAAQIWLLLYVFGFGIYSGISISVSKYIAVNNLANAKNNFRWGIYIYLIVYIPLLIVMLSLREHLFRIWAIDDAVAKVASEVSPWLAITVFLTGLKSTLQGFMVGLRKQIPASILAFSSYYLIMIPLSILFVIVLKWGDKGVWIAETIGYVVINICLIFYLLKVDFAKAIEETRLRMIADSQAISKINELEDANN